MVSSIKHFAPVYHILYGILVLLFGIHKLLEYLNWSHWFMRSYLDDLLVLPIILPFTLSLLRLIFRNEKLLLGLPLIITAIIMFTIVFELILPFYSSEYTRDYFDLLFYSLGGVMYWLYERKVLS